VLGWGGVDRAQFVAHLDRVRIIRHQIAYLDEQPLMDIIPGTGQNFSQIMAASIKKNAHPSQGRVKIQLLIQNKLFELPVLASVSGKTRRSMGLSKRKERTAIVATKLFLPLIWLVQQPPIERYFMRMMWGPDAVELITAARKLHAEARTQAA